MGPYLARGSDGLLALWAEPEEQEMGWFARAFDETGKPRDDVRRVASTSALPELLRLSPFHEGFLALWSAGAGEDPAFFSLGLGADGRLTAPPQTLPPPDAPPLWIELVPTPEGGLLVWAEPSRRLARVFALELDGAGAPASNPVALPGPVRAWQVAAAGQGAVALLATEQGRLSLVTLSRHAEVVRTREVPGAVGVGPDVDLVEVGDRLLYAFTSRPHLDEQLFVGLAELDGDPVGTPRTPVPPLGDQRLVDLVAGSGRAFLAWQDEVQRPGRIQVGELSPRGELSGEPVALPWNGAVPAPEFSADETLHALVWACISSLDCEEPVVPAQVDFDAALTPHAVNPWLGEGGVPDLAWNLRCADGSCFGLGAVFGDPSRVYLLGHEREAGEWLTPAWKLDQRTPRAREHVALLEPLVLSDFEVSSRPGGSLVAWLSYFDPSLPYVTPKQPAPDGRKAPVRAQLWTQWLPSDFGEGSSGATLPEPSVVSYRAHSPGGVALSAGAKANLLAWTALDDGVPQVFTTLVDDGGKKLAQQMLTRKKGNVDSVATLATEQGFVVGWIDDRSGTARPYLALLGDRLARKRPDQTVGEGAVATGFALTAVEQEVWHVRSELGADGASDLVLARLSGRNLALLSESPLASDGSRYHSPSFVPGAREPLLIAVRTGDGVSALAVFPLGPDAPSTPWTIEPRHDVVAFSAACEQDRCRLVATTESDQAQFVEAFTFGSSGVSSHAQVASLVATSSLEVAPVLRQNEAWLYDLSTLGKPRISRLRLDW